MKGTSLCILFVIGVVVAAESPKPTRVPCNNNNTCTVRRRGHFRRCPERLAGFCVYGRCRYLRKSRQAACVCEEGFVGARCAQVDIFAVRSAPRRRLSLLVLVCAASLAIAAIVTIACLCHHRCQNSGKRQKFSCYAETE